jgi:hypothetical protein
MERARQELMNLRKKDNELEQRKMGIRWGKICNYLIIPTIILVKQ